MGLEGLLDEDFHDGGEWTLVTSGSMGNYLSLPAVSKLVQTLHSQGRGSSPVKGGFSQA